MVNIKLPDETVYKKVCDRCDFLMVTNYLGCMRCENNVHRHKWKNVDPLQCGKDDGEDRCSK